MAKVARQRSPQVGGMPDGEIRAGDFVLPRAAFFDPVFSDEFLEWFDGLNKSDQGNVLDVFDHVAEKGARNVVRPIGDFLHKAETPGLRELSVNQNAIRIFLSWKATRR
jgi:hypothetical protein